jgi:hypothetical protein
MSSPARKSVYGFVLAASLATVNASASPTDSPLLHLVPSGAELVAGIADPGTPITGGRLLIVTVNNNRDLDDCLALLGVNDERTIEEVVTVASSSGQGDLNDHLLLAAGHFDSVRIFRAAIENGATRTMYDGTGLVVVRPFTREQQQMSQVRWLAILNERTLVFGVPSLVAKALDRHHRRDPTDPDLLQHLGQLHSDVNSWSVIAMAPERLNEHLAPYALPQSWTSIFKDANEVVVGIHYGHVARVAFAVHTRDAGLIEGLLTRAQLIPTSMSSVVTLRLQQEPIENDTIRGSFAVREKEFDKCLALFRR